MEHNCIVSFMLFVAIICIYCRVECVKASIVTQEVYSKRSFRPNIDTSTRRRKLIQKQAGSVRQDVCAGTKGRMPKTQKSPCRKLVVWVPKKDGFIEFVNVNDQSKAIDGFSIAIFCHALQLLPYNVQPIFKPFINESGKSNGSYNDLLEHIEGQACQAAAGDITIRGNRAQHVDFTIPYLNSEVYVLVHGSHKWNEKLWNLLRPFTWGLWVTIVAACLFTGVALGILEYRAANPKFSGPIYTQLIMVIWFPIATFFFQEGKIKNSCSKVVLVMWLSMIFIIIQIFTATLSSWLTLDQLLATFPSNFENAGYQYGTFLNEFITQRYNCSPEHLVPLKSVEEYKTALSTGRVNAIVDELPYIELFLARYGSEYMKFGPINQESGIAFAFPHKSPLLQDFSRAVINVTEGKIMTQMKQKYLGIYTTDKTQPNQAQPQSLGVQSFTGLFVLMGTVIIAAIISSEISLMRENRKVIPIISTDI
ncbi:hypothetical protein LXL04_028312 [Taraxacum kok-saghyz]